MHVDLNEYRLSKWSKAIRKRDKNICQICLNKYKTSELDAHHIKPKEDYPELAYDLDNGISLCNTKIYCHTKVLHSDDRNVTRFRMIFHPYMRRNTTKKFNKENQNSI